jgi:hypothetical protein
MPYLINVMYTKTFDLSKHSIKKISFGGPSKF